MLASMLDQVQSFLRTMLEVLEYDPPGSDPLAVIFRDVFEQGDCIDSTELPIALLTYDGERVTELTLRTRITMPFTVQVIFETTGSELPRTVGNHLLGELKKMFANNRNLTPPGVVVLEALAVDTRYTGGGNFIVAMNKENACRTWSFAADFEVDYRHSITDPATIA